MFELPTLDRSNGVLPGCRPVFVGSHPRFSLFTTHAAFRAPVRMQRPQHEISSRKCTRRMGT